MSEMAKLLKEDLGDVSCMLCLTKSNSFFKLNQKLSETISDVLYIQVENIIKLPKRICHRCFFIVECINDFRNVTIRNIINAENKLTEGNSLIAYDKPIIFNIITDKVLEEENIPLNLDVTEYIANDMEEKNNDDLLVPHSYRHANSYEQEVLPYKQSTFQCSTCPNAFNKKTSLIHHQRKHRREERKERFRSTSSKRSKVFTCEDCDNATVYSTITELHTHRKSHLSSYFCRMGCGADFKAHFERDFHESTCNERFAEDELKQPGVRTRSRSRLSSLSRSRCSSMDSLHLEDSCNSESANHSTKSTDTNNKQNLYEKSTKKKLLSNGYKSPHSRPSRSRKRR